MISVLRLGSIPSILLLVFLPSTALCQPVSLNDAIATAFATNPTLTIANLQIRQSQATLAQAQSAKRFQLSFNSTPSVSTANVYQSPPKSEVFTAIQNSVQVPIPLGSKASSAISQAQSQLQASQAQAHVARRLVAAQIRSAYFSLLRLRAELDGANQQLTSAQQALTNAQNRFSARDVAELDVLQAKTPVALAQAGVIQAETEVSAANETLNSLLGVRLDAQTDIVDAASSSPSAPLLTIDDVRTLAQKNSPDIAVAEYSIQADVANVRVAKAYRELSVSLQAIDLRSKDVTSFSSEDTLQAQLSVPLNDGGAGKASIDLAAAQLESAQAQRDTTIRTVLVNVSAAYLNANSSVSQLTASKIARDSAQTTYDKTVLGYQNGLNPVVDVLSAQAALGQARLSYIQALYDAAEAQSNLYALISADDAGDTTAPSPGIQLSK